MDRYHRQILFPAMGTTGQKKLQKATVAIVGVGALGSVSAELLCRAGVGTLILIDRDFVDLTNLQRQALYTEQDIGQAKALAAEKHLNKINSEIKIKACVEDLHFSNIDALLKGVDIIVDGTDNLDTRFLLNEYSLRHQIPWIYGGAIQDRGFVMTFTGKEKPCFQCVVKDKADVGTCDTVGVLNTITHLVGSLQAQHCIQLLLGTPVQGLLHVRLMDNHFDLLHVKGNPSCTTCRGDYPHLEGREQQQIMRFCRTGQFQVFAPKPFSLKMLKQRLQKNGKVEDLGFCLVFQGMKIFKDRVLIPAGTEKEAKSIYARYFGH